MKKRSRNKQEFDNETVSEMIMREQLGIKPEFIGSPKG
jgi:hypothetical protein